MATKHAWHNYLTCDSCLLLDKSVRPVNDGNFCPSCVPNPPEADTLRRQRDEALRVLKLFVDAHRHNIYSNLTYTPYVEACRVLAQYEQEDNTTQEGSNE